MPGNPTRQSNAVTLGAIIALWASSALAADLETTEVLFRSGDYEGATAIAQSQVDKGVWNERWSRLLLSCQLATGKYEQAKATYEAAIQRYSGSLVLRRQGIQAYRYCQDEDSVARVQAEFIVVMRRAARYATRDNVLAAGRYFAERGEDAREVLKQFYDRVKEADPEYLETYIATAELALSKGDFAVAADTLREAIAVDSTDPRVFYLQAKAFAPTDSKTSTEAINMALTVNPRHVDSLLFVAENAIDAERYDQANAAIESVLEVNVHEPRAWALLAVLAHLEGNYEIEKLMRAAALSTWAKNPEVDHLIGRKLSDKYRFQEGSEYQQRSLEFEPQNAAANFQLSQDLLRLGHDDVGWELAQQVQSEDPYNVVAYNLVSLHDKLKGFSKLTRDGIVVRMAPDESVIYGDAVLDLLTEARDVLCKKYDVEPDAPIIVEIFDKQSDFAIRTFGLPGGAGFLGVCFGRVITANSPASQGKNPSNWRSVLWHEFCHVVTLSKTKNRMPRWLSEGISVYEERQKNPAWTEKMSPTYKWMIMRGEVFPISDLSAAFLKPKSPVHLQFAYFQSALAVELLIDRYGLDALKGVLEDLGDGLAINDALAKRCAPLSRLDQQYLQHVRQQSDSYASDLSWSEDGPPSDDQVAARKWFVANPDDYRTLKAKADQSIAAGEYEAAIETLESLRAAGAVDGGKSGILASLAKAYQSQDETKKEIEVLQQQIELAGDALFAHVRLAEFAADNQDWPEVDRHADAILAIHPLIPDGHRWKARVATELEKPADVIGPLEKLLELDPIDPAKLQFRLASAYESLNEPRVAKRWALRALERAPRYRDALALLLRVSEPISP